MNIIVVVTDTLRRDYLSCYGNTEVITPNLDRFAESALIFRRLLRRVIPDGAGARRLDDRALHLCLPALGSAAAS